MAVPTSYDEIMVAIVTSGSEVTALCNSRMYHIETYQQLANTSQTIIPCIVYRLVANNPEIEMSGLAGYFAAHYMLTVVSKESSDIRSIATEIMNLGNEYNNDINYETYFYLGFQWLDCVDDNEENEFNIELEAKGYKFVNLALYFNYVRTTHAYSSQ